MSDKYYLGKAKQDGECMFCGRTGVDKEKRRGRDGKLRPVNMYWQVWEKTNWFRGDDEIIGKACSQCKKKLPDLMEKREQE